MTKKRKIINSKQDKIEEDNDNDNNKKEDSNIDDNNDNNNDDNVMMDDMTNEIDSNNNNDIDVNVSIIQQHQRLSLLMSELLLKSSTSSSPCLRLDHLLVLSPSIETKTTTTTITKKEILSSSTHNNNDNERDSKLPALLLPSTKMKHHRDDDKNNVVDYDDDKFNHDDEKKRTKKISNLHDIDNSNDDKLLLQYICQQQQQQLTTHFLNDLLSSNNNNNTQRVDEKKKYQYSSNNGSSNNDDNNNMNLLQQLLYPFDIDTFMETSFRQRAVYIPDFNRILNEKQQQHQHQQQEENKKATKKKKQNNKKIKLKKEELNNDVNNNDNSMNHRFSMVGNIGLYDLDPLLIYQNTSSDNIFIWLQQHEDEQQQQPNSNMNHKLRTKINSIEIADPTSAYALYQLGKHSTYCRAPAYIEHTFVSHLLHNIGLGCGQYDHNHDPDNINNNNNNTAVSGIHHHGIQRKIGRGEVEIFISGTADSITNWHTDFQENFTIQLSGIKRWTIQKGTVEHPIRGNTPHYTNTDTIETQLLSSRLSSSSSNNHQSNLPPYRFGYPSSTYNNNAIGDIETITLYPGDFFYFPAGMWHMIEVIEPGVSMNISLMSMNYADITCHAIHQLLLKQSSWRQCVVDYNPTTNNTTHHYKGGASHHLRQLLKELPNIISEFEKNRGGDAILPPILLHKDTFTRSDYDKLNMKHNDKQLKKSNDDDNDDSHDEEDDKVDTRSDDEKVITSKTRKKDSNDDDRSTDDDDEEEDDDDNENDQNDKNIIIDVDTFVLPCNYILDIRYDSDHYKIFQNPLAILLSQDEIAPPSTQLSLLLEPQVKVSSSSSSIHPVNDISICGNNVRNMTNDVNETSSLFDYIDVTEEENNSSTNVYILNVNFAGNEMLESTIRVCFQTNTQWMNEILKQLGMNISNCRHSTSLQQNTSNIISSENQQTPNKPHWYLSSLFDDDDDDSDDDDDVKVATHESVYDESVNNKKVSNGYHHLINFLIHHGYLLMSD